MADTSKAEDVPETVANGENEVKDPASSNAAGEKKNGEASKEQAEQSKVVAENAGEGQDTVEEKNGDVKANGNDDEASTHSPDHKRKDDNDHYRDGNKRSRGDGRGRGRGRGRGGNRGGNNFTRNNQNIIRTFDEQPETDDPVEIRRQVEFYFSDSNLPVDGYLLSLTNGSENRPVDLKSIHNFKRMRHFQPFSAVVAAVKDSRVLDVTEDGNDAKVARKVPLEAKFTLDTSENKRLLTTDTMERSIYAKGFGEETKSTHLDIEEFFAPYGPINSVRLRRSEDGDFKGSVFVEFADVGTQKRFLELDPKPTWGDDGKELQVMSKQIYVDRKHQDILDGNVRPKSPRRSGYSNHGGNKRGGRGGFRDRRYSDKRDRSRSPGQDDWKNRRDRDQRNGNRNDNKRGQRGGRGGRGRGGRGGRDDRKRRDRDDDEEDEEMPSRAEAEADAGAEKSEGGNKKRAREEDDDGAAEGGEVKKVKETEVEV